MRELAWRHNWQRIYAEIGDAVWADREPNKTGVTEYSDTFPDDITNGATGLACIDA